MACAARPDYGDFRANWWFTRRIRLSKAAMSCVNLILAQPHLKNVQNECLPTTATKYLEVTILGVPTMTAFIFSRFAHRAGALAASLALLGSASCAAAHASSQADLSALLKKQTQEFSQAGQRGDAATLARYLDPDVVFTNETGQIATKKDLVEGTSPTPAGAPKLRIEVTNWALRRQGDVATATFIDELTQNFQDQQLVLRFQSTETWAKRPDGWKMIASHTMNVVRAPTALAVPSTDLDAYVGTYQVDPSYVVQISRSAEGLLASANGGAAVPLNVEIKDVLFTPAAPNVRKIFQRDGAGRIVGYINRRDGTDLIFRKVD
jgi:ketosteroid isomerase-like protein